MLLTERTRLLTVNADGPNQLIFLEHRDADHGAITATFNSGDDKWVTLHIALQLREVGDLGGLLGLCCAPEAAIRRRMDECGPCIRKGRGRVVHGHGAEAAAFTEIEGAELGVTDAHCIVQYGGKNRPQIPLRAGDDAPNLCW